MIKNIDPVLVQRFACFQSLDADQIAAFAAQVEGVRLQPGQILFGQGEPGDSIYLLVNGQVLIRLCGPVQNDRTIATLGAGAILGEMGPLLNSPRTATVVAATESHLWRISAFAFHEALKQGDSWATSFLLGTAQVLGRRVMGMNEELVRLSEKLSENPAPPQFRKAVAEIEQLRKRLATEWTF